MTTKKLHPYRNFNNDIPASLVVFLVAIPLCLGIAMASGAPLVSGMIAGIVGGIVVGLLSHSSLGVSGPAAGLATVVFLAIDELGSFPIFLSAVVLSGIIQVLLGFAKAGFIGYFFPSSVIKGMLSGIGIIIILKQIPHAVGYDGVYEGSLSFAQEDGFNTFTELVHLINLVSPGPLIISLTALAIIILWERPWIKQIKWLHAIPAPLLAVLSGIFLGKFFENMPQLSLEGDQMVALPVLENLSSVHQLFTFPDFSAITQPNLIIIALTIAIVGSIETLLSTEATDKLDPYKRVTPTSRELFSQGIGNIISGMIGGLPITQVIVRSSTNIISGAKTKTSTVLHGIWLLASLLFFPLIMNQIPLASLAIILIAVGYKLANPQLFRQIFDQGYEQFIPFIATIIGILFTDLLTGVLIGLGIALLTILRSNYQSPFYAVPDLSHPEQGIRIQLAEDMSFLTRAQLLHTLSLLPDGLEVIIDASKTRRMHPDITELIDDFIVNAKTRKLKVEYIEMPENFVEDHVTYIHQLASDKAQQNNENKDK